MKASVWGDGKIPNIVLKESDPKTVMERTRPQDKNEENQAQIRIDDNGKMK